MQHSVIRAVFWVLIGFSATLPAYSQTPPSPTPTPPILTYKRQDIGDARFGTGTKEDFAKKAVEVAGEVNKVIFGQETAALVLQDRLVQYIEGFPNHQGEPVVLNLIGLPGIGKTGMLKTLEKMGFPVLFFNAQDYVNGKTDGGLDFTEDLYMKVTRDGFHNSRVSRRPVIVVIDELDKLPEIDSSGVEKTHPLIGTLNSAISEGSIPIRWRNTLDVSNILFVTTMNFSPKEMEVFTGEVLARQKSFYDMTLEDFTQFDKWIREQPSARYKVLSRLFRSNTVSRLAPNTVILQPLSLEVYRRIIQLVADEAIASAQSGPHSAKRVEVTVDPSLIEFLAQQTVYAPSGARETIFRAKALIEQLINYGTKSIDGENTSSLDQPRAITLKHENNVAKVIVTPIISLQGRRSEGQSFVLDITYDNGARSFLPPSHLAKVKPTYPKPEQTVKPVTKKEVREARFSENAQIPEVVIDTINATLLGQEATVNLVIDDFKKYLGRLGPAKKEPSMRVLSGFPGIGKSELVKQIGANLKLPVVKINMQQFSSDSPDTVKDFIQTLRDSIDNASGSSEKSDGKYILLFEELDKVFEVNPQDGRIVNRPIMAIIKDLLNEGQVSVSSPKVGNIHLDVRDAFSFITMNFSVDRFGFDADPRLTTIDDVMAAWAKLNSTQMAIKELLGTMFLPETVSRLLARFTIMKPLDENAFRKLIDIQVKNVIAARTLDREGRNVGKIEIELTDAYKAYLYREAVIPSEGARHTVVSVQSKISSHLEAVLQSIPRRSAYATAPLKVKLDYVGNSTEVVATVAIADKPNDEPKEIVRRVVALQFPSPAIDGQIEAFRMLVSAHEFGHAFIATRLGLRYQHVVVVSPTPGTGGYVKFAGGSFTAKSKMANIYSTLASRALERIIMNEDPVSNTSVMGITSGSSSDIRQATFTLYNMIYQLGMDPQGGTIDANFNLGGGRYASIQDMPADLTEKLGLIMRDMETLIVKDLMATHTRDWFVERIVKLAKKGVMDEKEFYELVGYRFPGDVASSEEIYSDEFLKLFGEHLTPRAQNTSDALSRRRRGQSVAANKLRESYLKSFEEIIRRHLHGPTPAVASCAQLLANN